MKRSGHGAIEAFMSEHGNEKTKELAQQMKEASTAKDEATKAKADAKKESNRLAFPLLYRKQCITGMKHPQLKALFEKLKIRDWSAMKVADMRQYLIEHEVLDINALGAAFVASSGMCVACCFSSHMPALMQPLTCPGSSAQATGAHAPGLKEGNTPSDETAVGDRFEQDNESGKNGMADSTASSSSSDCGTSEDTDDDDGDERPLCLHQIPNTHILLIFFTCRRR